MRLAILSYSPFWSIMLLALGYLALMLLIYLFQARFLYFPDNSSADLAGHFGLRPWPAGENFRGFISDKQLENSKGTFLVWHGNGGSALDRTYFPDALERRGYRVILAEYPGYCGRPGKLSEKSFVSDALSAADDARNEFGGPIYLIGESLGCGVATAVAKERPWVNGIVLITPWADLPTLAQSKFWYLPARWFVRDQYDNIRNLSGYTGPVAVFLAGHDEVVPRKHGQRLFDSLKSPKHLWLFPASGHNSWPAGAKEKWWDEAVDFISAEKH
ncbi:MAG: alpha/beta fold hydrolase [Kiritimatiellia bacterium]|nr:alpha/beta fold hydrolase [Kiritimatiellia bacterium]